MKVTPILNDFNKIKLYRYNNKPENSEPNRTKDSDLLISQFNDSLMFTARVDKGLDRFYDKNKDIMPVTVRTYIEESIPDRTQVTPMEAQRKAFEYLTIADSVDDIRGVYPEFAHLKNPEESRATNGLLFSLRDNAELLDLMGGALKSGENFTIYLAKKIYLDNKTIEEINKDLEEDLNPDFKAEFRYHNPDSQYVLPGTLRSIGIEMPKFEYRNSLWFTTEGYSDKRGDILRAVWEAMPPEQRTARARKSIENFEKWWDSIPRQKKLEMIADKISELEMLEKYRQDNPKAARKYFPKNSQGTENKSADSATAKQNQPPITTKLSRDELFIELATLNLKIFKASLSDADYEAINTIRLQKRAAVWENMSPEDKTAYINELRKAQEPLRYAMIDAWNNSFDIIVALSEHLTKKQVERPNDVLFTNKEFSEFQSRVMTEFWSENPQFCRELGDHIIHSQGKVRRAMNSGEFEELKKEILREQNKRRKELEKYKLAKAKETNLIQPKEDRPEYMKQFMNAYKNALPEQMYTLPPSYAVEYFSIIQDFFEPEVINSWTKNLRREPLTEQDIENLEYLKNTEPPEAAYINRPFELAGSEILHEMTGSPIVYSLSFSDIKVALSQIARGEKNIDIISTSLGNKRITIPIIKRNLDMTNFDNVYKLLRAPISDGNVLDIAESYFDSKNGDYTDLVNYLKPYGQGLGAVLWDTSFHPQKNIILKCMVLKMPENIKDNYTCLVVTPEQQIKNEVLIKSAERFMNVHKNLPETFLNEYIREVNSNLRRDNDFKVSSPSLIVYDKKHLLKNEFKLNLLAMETALADYLYESSGDNRVYGFELEDLNSLIRQLKSVKKYPETFVVAEILDGKQTSVSVTFKKPILQGNMQTAYLQRKYQDYMDDIKDRQNSPENPWDMEELICALNPDENNMQKDDILQEKISKYQVKFS